MAKDANETNIFDTIDQVPYNHDLDSPIEAIGFGKGDDEKIMERKKEATNKIYKSDEVKTTSQAIEIYEKSLSKRELALYLFEVERKLMQAMENQNPLAALMAAMQEGEE